MTVVLIVEDEGIIARDLQVTLLRLGYDVPETVNTGAAAVDAARRLRPDVILMDIHLQGNMDGTEAAKAIRAEQDPAVVYLTAYADEETLDRAQEAGPYGYLVKPYEEETLRTTIETALRRRRTDRERDDRLAVQAAALDEMAEGLLLTSPDGIVRLANGAAKRLLGEDPTGTRVQTVHDVTDEDGARGEAAWQRLLFAAGKPRVWTLDGRGCVVVARRVRDSVMVVVTAGTDKEAFGNRAARALTELERRASALI